MQYDNVQNELCRYVGRKTLTKADAKVRDAALEIF